MTDQDNQNAITDDDEFIHRNWITDKRIAGSICLLPGIGLVLPLFLAYGLSPLEQLLPSAQLFISHIDVSIDVTVYSYLVLLALSGTLAMIWGLWKLLQISVR